MNFFFIDQMKTREWIGRSVFNSLKYTKKDLILWRITSNTRKLVITKHLQYG